MKYRGRLLLSLLLLAPLLRAETLLEFDFQAAEGAQTKAIHSVAKASNVGELQNDAQIDPGLTGISTGIPALRKGALVIDRQMEGACFALRSTSNSGRGNATFASYTGTSDFGTGTMVVVFQPGFSKASRSNVFFCTEASSTQAGNFSWRAQDAGLTLTVGGKGATTITTIPDAHWESGQWYLLAISWRENAPPTIYARLLGGKGLFAVGDKPVTTNRPITEQVRIGNGHALKDKQPDNEMDGRMAYFLWTSDFTGAEQGYEALYERIVNGK